MVEEEKDEWIVDIEFKDGKFFLDGKECKSLNSPGFGTDHFKEDWPQVKHWKVQLTIECEPGPPGNRYEAPVKFIRKFFSRAVITHFISSHVHVHR